MLRLIQDSFPPFLNFLMLAKTNFFRNLKNFLRNTAQSQKTSNLVPWLHLWNPGLEPMSKNFSGQEKKFTRVSLIIYDQVKGSRSRKEFRIKDEKKISELFNIISTVLKFLFYVILENLGPI